MSEGWKLTPRQAACKRCARPFEESEKHFSMLWIGEGELRRDDQCEICFSAGEGVERALLWWRTTHVPARRKGLALDIDLLEGLFGKLETCQDVRVLELRYVICLLLMRKRRLKVVRIERAGAEGNPQDAFLVRRPRSQEEFRVQVFDFGPERMVELRDELRALLSGVENELGPDSAVA
jgi:hypothetical protein